MRNNDASVFFEPSSETGANKLRIVTSPGAAGRCVWAGLPLALGEEVLTFGGERYTHDQLSDFTHCLEIAPGVYLGPSGEADDYVNHSCHPNCHVAVVEDHFVLRANAAIAAGDEITFDYSTVMWNDPTSFVCKCGWPNCRGVIRSFPYLPERTKARYIALGFVPFLSIGSLTLPR